MVPAVEPSEADLVDDRIWVGAVLASRVGAVLKAHVDDCDVSEHDLMIVVRLRD